MPTSNRLLAPTILLEISRHSLRSVRRPWICTTCAQNAQSRRAQSTQTKQYNDGSQKPYYITTPIFYVNAAPHIGHMYTMILGDAIKRWHQLAGRKALLMTGTDEHGQKIQRAAAEAKSEPKAFCDKGAEMFRTLAQRCDVSYDRFFRTTDDDHKQAVEYAWELLKERGYLYESKHEGWYAVSDETFYSDLDVHLWLDPSTGKKLMVSKETGKQVEWVSEVNYKFRLSAFKDKLLDLYRNNPQWINPSTRLSQVMAGVESGEDIKDLSVSRPTSRLNWGIQVPGDETQTIYVWLDALICYITASGYPWTPGRESLQGWPADCQIIGKDIIRFHCIYWPAFLMALDLPVPQRFVAHGHWLLGNAKMSKSVGNVVNPFFALDRFGVDLMRYFLLSNGNFKKDSSYDNQIIINCYKKDLQAQIGNLARRITFQRQGLWTLRNAVVAIKETSAQRVPPSAQEAHIKHEIDSAVKVVKLQMERENVSHALAAIKKINHETNAYFSNNEPWNIANSGTDPASARHTVDVIIYTCAEALRISGILLQPFIPGKAGELLDLLGVKKDRRMLDDCQMGADVDYGDSLTSASPDEKTGFIFPPLNGDR